MRDSNGSMREQAEHHVADSLSLCRLSSHYVIPLSLCQPVPRTFNSYRS